MSNPTDSQARADALSHIELTFRANEDNGPDVRWTTDEVLELLYDLAERLRLDCDCEDREAIVDMFGDGMSCGTCGATIEASIFEDWNHTDGSE